MAVIEVDRLTKEYRLGALRGVKHTLANLPKRLMGGDVEQHKIFKALDNLSFSAAHGEVVGIIGANGAGKSTLLKMIAGVSTPTSGSVRIHGRISPLIEVGAGFIPDFTGRENVYLNGVILGMTRKELDKKFDEIVDFAEMSRFIDTPVKRYSSGMQVKLAFAVATSVDSDILIVDEVLAVGDLAFQRKCYDRVEEFIRKRDRTILIVSHNLRQIQRLCTRAICIEQGRVSMDGAPIDVCNYFFENSNKRIAATRSQLQARVTSSGDFDLQSIRLLSPSGEEVSVATSGIDLVVEIGFRVRSSAQEVLFTLGIHTTDLFFIAVKGSDESIQIDSIEPGTYSILCRLPKFPLEPGVYAIHLSAESGRSNSPLFRGDNLLTFEVAAPEGAERFANSGRGVIALTPEWSHPKQVFGEDLASFL